MGKLFGTDGVRGVANSQLTPKMAFNIAKAVAIYASKDVVGRKPKVIVSRDTRVSGNMIAASVCAGLTSMGVDAEMVGILPTPSVHVLVKQKYADMGIMITASHNPGEYNGIKIVNKFGMKATDEDEAEIEQLVCDIEKFSPCDALQVGKIFYNEDLPLVFADYQLSVLKSDLSGVSVCLDCANGATYKIAPYIFQKAGATVDAINATKDGEDINAGCGSTHPELLAEYLKSKKSDIGFAFDGDGDRMIAVLGDGTILQGDEMMFLLAYYFNDKKMLKHNLFATNQITNMGFDKSLEKLGVKVKRINEVGGKPLQKFIMDEDINLAAEDNGHIIFGDFNVCSDGIISGLVLSEMLKQGYNLKEILKLYNPYKQEKLNVKINDMQKQAFKDGKMDDVILDIEKKLGERGRVVVRLSGTEPLIRFMAEGEDDAIAGINEMLKEIILKF